MLLFFQNNNKKTNFNITNAAFQLFQYELLDFCLLFRCLFLVWKSIFIWHFSSFVSLKNQIILGVHIGNAADVVWNHEGRDYWPKQFPSKWSFQLIQCKCLNIWIFCLHFLFTFFVYIFCLHFFQHVTERDNLQSILMWMTPKWKAQFKIWSLQGISKHTVYPFLILISFENT